MTVQMLLVFYDFCQKLSIVSLANSKTPWRHHFHYKSMKCGILFLPKMLKKCSKQQNAEKQKKKETVTTVVTVSVTISVFFLKSSQKFEIVKPQIFMKSYQENQQVLTKTIDLFLYHHVEDGLNFLQADFQNHGGGGDPILHPPLLIYYSTSKILIPVPLISIQF